MLKPFVLSVKTRIDNAELFSTVNSTQLSNMVYGNCNVKIKACNFSKNHSVFIIEIEISNKIVDSYKWLRVE